VKKLPVSAYVITLNEEKNIRRCLESLRDFDEIVVVDSLSEDATVEICREFTDKVYQRPWPGHTPQYEYAVEQTKHEWVFWLDADEVASPELLQEFRQIFGHGQDGELAGYYISRMTRYMGRWIRHGLWYPDYKLRLFKKAAGRYTGDDPHMKVVVTGKTRCLEGKILHYTIESFSDHLRTIDRYAEIRAQGKINSSARFSVAWMVFHPILNFLKAYVIKAGFLDRMPGFIIAVTSAFAIFARYAKFWEKKYSVRQKP
jgi:glycosyltransferase involved in cell wall biosynthesis